MLYFAYGSNLDPRQMAERCPRSPVVAVARLDGHRLTFPRRSPIRRCAVASIEPFAGGIVWGVLHRLHDEDLVRLDAREGHFPDRPDENRYDRLGIPVPFGREMITAMTYVARPSPDPGLPSPEYLAHLLFGATHHGLPEDYVAMLKELPTAPADASLMRDGSVDASEAPG
jgi:hypothetical protein